MSVFTPEQQDELTRLIQMQVARSDLATLVRQLQGKAAGQIVAGTVFPTYSASATTATLTIPHGHAAAPLAVDATVANGGHIGHASGDATNLSVFSETRSGSTATGPVVLSYIAVFEV